MGQLARRSVAASDQAFQPGAILPGQAHGVVPLARHREVSSCSLPRGRLHERRHSPYPRRNIAANQSCQDTRASFEVADGQPGAQQVGGEPIPTPPTADWISAAIELDSERIEAQKWADRGHDPSTLYGLP